MKVRLAPFSLNGNVIYTVSNSYVVGSGITPPLAPTLNNPQPAFTGLTASPRWLAQTGALGYSVGVYTSPGGVLLRTIEVGTALQALYTRANATADGATGRAFTFKISAYNAGGNGAEVSTTLTNPTPTPPDALAVGSPTGSNYPATWAFTDDGDLLEFRVYTSLTTGFTADGSTLLTTRVTPDATIPAPTRPLYWRVATVDQWGAELGLSAEAVIP
jgi:hypothetical protein